MVDICKRNDDQIPTKNPPSKYLVITKLILREDLGDTLREIRQGMDEYISSENIGVDGF